MPSYDISYTYDAVGNRLTKTDNLASETTTSTYDAANQLETSVDASGTTNYNYDASGNLTEIEDPSSIVTSYSYDVENHRTKVELPSSEVVTSTFNGDGQRVKREDSSKTRKFIWDGATYLSETDENDVTQVVYTQTPEVPNGYGRLISQRRKDGAGWTTDFFLFDALGSTTQLTDASETVLETYDYDAWGNLLSSNTLQPAFLYVGEHGYYADWIENSVLDYYVRARTYDATTARWLSEDPSGFTHGTNLYQYVANSPTSLADPSGLILVALDGTDSATDIGFPPPQGKWNPAAIITLPSGQTRIRSHVYEFWNDYGWPNFYMSGPKRSGRNTKQIFDKAYGWACRLWCLLNTNRITPKKKPKGPLGYDLHPIDIVGHSRGGHIGLGIAKKLNDEGCCCRNFNWTDFVARFKPVDVRFMGLYDPVDMVLFREGANDVGGNVKNSVVIRAAAEGRLHPCVDRALFNRNEVPSAQIISGHGTHGALGGYPCFDNITSTATHLVPRWITPTKDVTAAIRSDMTVRAFATARGVRVPIANIATQAGYGYGPPPPICVRMINAIDNRSVNSRACA